MKKTLSLLLALCMLLFALPVMAETADPSGTWYLSMLGMTVGTFELGADGNCTVKVETDAEAQDLTGTWAQDGANVSITINEQTLALTYDGTQLLFDLESMAALGVDTSSASMSIPGVDMSTLIQITREPGTLTLKEFTEYSQNGTVPEGKTEEEMQAFMGQMMATVFSLMGAAGGETAGTGTGTAEEGPAPELTVVEDNFYLREGYGSQEGYYVAKVQNQNDVPVYLSNAVMTLLDKDGNEVGKQEYMGTTGSRYLEPGEVTYFSMYADVNEGAAVDSYKVELSPTAATYQTPDTTLEVAAAELRVQEGYYTSYSAAATVTNNTEAPLARINVLVAVKNSDGKLMDLCASGLYQNELGAGSTIILVDTLDSRVADYCTANNLTLGEVEAIGWVDNY